MRTRDPARPGPDDRVRLPPHLTVLHRQAGELQLGFDHADAVVLADPDGRLPALLDLLDGRHRLADLTTAAARRGLTAARVDQVVTALAGAGLLRPVPEAGPVETVRLLGLGPVGGRIGDQLLGAGIPRLVVVDPTGALVGAAWSPDRDRVHVVDRLEPDGSSAALTVVVSSTWEPDRASTAALLHAGAPHLLVRARPGGAVVGPLVVPGRTSCLRCADLARTRADPAWPMLLAQLCRRSAEWDPLAADWAAALATTQVLGHLAGRNVETASATTELAAPDWSGQRRVWPADPACGCSWRAHAEW